MKELKYNFNILTLPKQKDKRRKKWSIAQSRKSHPLQVIQNNSVEIDYHKVLQTVKQSCLKPGEIYYERNWKSDLSEGLFGMHSFVTPTFSWTLDCDLCYDYQITYAFGRCSFEPHIRILLDAYPLDRQANEVYPQPDYRAFYEAVIAIRDPQYLHSL